MEKFGSPADIFLERVVLYVCVFLLQFCTNCLMDMCIGRNMSL
jgi:hypothetical protein